MNTGEKYQRARPALKTNFLSSITMWWTTETFRKAMLNKSFTFNDLRDPCEADKSQRLGDRLEKEWNNEIRSQEVLEFVMNGKSRQHLVKKCANPSLSKALFRQFFWPNVLLGLMCLVDTAGLKIHQMILQGWVIKYFITDPNSEPMTRNAVITYGILLIVSKLLSCFIYNNYIRYSMVLGMRARVACCSLMYRKMLRLNKIIAEEAASGQIINLMSNDVNRFDFLFTYLHYIWVTPIQMIIVTYIMWSSVGIMEIVGIGVLLISSVPFQILVPWIGGVLRAKIAKITDERVQFMAELVSGMQVIKMYAWEKPFQKIVNTMRSNEMHKIIQSLHVQSVFQSSFCFVERISLFLTLVLYVLSGKKLTADIAFVLATLFNNLQLTASILLPSGIMMLMETGVSVGRIQQFLMLEEKTPFEDEVSLFTKRPSKESFIGTESKDQSQCAQLKFEQVSANWTQKQSPPTLQDISFSLEAGKLCGLLGPVGSGKSAILNVILRELQIEGGMVLIDKYRQSLAASKFRTGFHMDPKNLDISYASQEPWLFNGSIRDNILFGQPFDAKRYNQVTEVCALRDDFNQLAYGDATIVEERGSSLSGGQKARVNLARAVYRDADLYLLDDPLSAVDSRVARHLFEECIVGFLRGKTRILATHQMHFIREVDVVVYLSQGTVRYSGNFDDIKTFDPYLMSILEQEVQSEDKTDIGESDESQEELSDSSKNKRPTICLGTMIEENNNFIKADVEIAKREETDVVVDWKLFKTYFCFGASHCFFFMMLIAIVLAQVFMSGSDYWLSCWTNLEDRREQLHNHTFDGSSSGGLLFRFHVVDDDGLLSTDNAIYIYTLLIVLCVFFCIVRNVMTSIVMTNSSKRLHKSMFSNLLDAKMSFFSSNPSGKILNRFSKDIGAVDELLPRSLTFCLQINSALIGVLLVIMFADPWMILPIIIMVIIFYFCNKINVRTIQGLRSLEGAAKSPGFSHVKATLDGFITIRSSPKGIEQKLIEEFDSFQDVHSGAYFLIICTSSAVGLFIDLIILVLIIIITFTAIFVHMDEFFGGNIGLSLSQSAILSGMVPWGMRNFSEFMSQMTSVSRVFEYVNLPRESLLESDKAPPENWPRRGRIKFKNFSMRYAFNSQRILKNLNLRIEGGWKVGIVGRTGAGKSSIISALFRLYSDELEGRISIDGQDTSTLGLRDLRSKISIIPQDPVLFSQTIRFNLDPFSQCQDSVLRDALRDVRLAHISLDQMVTEKGCNFSVGQRQLICLARAIVRDNKILVLDEATANIDNQTDAIIQETIRSKFARCTVLTIAHRLNTVVDSDRIVVMEKGRIVEFGCPHELLTNNPNGYFSGMVEQTGPDTASRLKDLARQNCVKNMKQISLDIADDSDASFDSICSGSTASFNTSV